MDNKKELVNSIESFKKELDTYYNYFSQFYSGGIIKDSEYRLGHPELIKSSHKLQVKFAMLPVELRERLIDLEFEIFLHCNNIVDFYNLRKYIIDNNYLYNVASLVERVAGEVDTAFEISLEGNMDLYNNLPKRRYDFYRDVTPAKLIKKEPEIDEDNTSDLVDDDAVTAIPDEKESDSFMDNLKNIEEVTTKSENIVKKALSTVSLVVKFGKNFI